METKICSKCKEEKELCFFSLDKTSKDGIRCHCNECRRIESKEYRTKNPEKRKETLNKYFEKNREDILEKSKTNYYLDLEKTRDVKRKSYHKNKEKHKERLKEYRIVNRERRTKYQRDKINNDIQYKLSANVRNRIITFLKKEDISKTNKTFDIVGCTPQFLKEHLESQFKDGMSWDNYGFYGWHIDHIIPLSSAKTEEELYGLCHYTNLQPLWAKDNLSKGSKIL
jgi:hypothetical protein